MSAAPWTAAAEALRRLALPGQCAVCRRFGLGRLCPECVARFAAEVARCPRCALRASDPAQPCAACRNDSAAFDACIAACDYGFPWDRLIAAMKFDTHPELALALAPLLAQAVRRRGGALPQCVVPVPLAPRRLAERGFNQAWELARSVARALHCRADAELLERRFDTVPQASLALAARRGNLRGAFGVAPARRSQLQGAHVALVDDVMTSGATLHDAAAALRSAGAARIDVWVLARTPAPAA